MLYLKLMTHVLAMAYFSSSCTRSSRMTFFGMHEKLPRKQGAKSQLIIGELFRLQEGVATGEVSQRAKNNYITDIFEPAMRNSPVFAEKKFPGGPIKAASAMVVHIARFGNEFDVDVLEPLLPLLKQLGDTASLVVLFLQEAMNTLGWTKPNRLSMIG
jgi:hypothetical protein